MKVALGSIMERAPAGRLFEAIATLAELPATPSKGLSHDAGRADSPAPDRQDLRHRAGCR